MTIFRTFGKTAVIKKYYCPKPASLPPLGVQGDKFKKGQSLLPFSRLAEKSCAVNNYLINRLFVDGTGLFC